MAPEAQDKGGFSLAIRLFGPMDVRLNGAPLPPLRTRKGLWLLALLTMRAERQVERSWLAGMLWPESAESIAYANLRRSLYDLRRMLGLQAYRLQSADLHTLGLDLTGAFVDVVLFDQAIERGDMASLEQAVELYRGPLLEGCYEEWALPERVTREQAYLKALELLAQYALTREDAPSALVYLRRAVCVDPLRESAQRALMQALATIGDHAAATQVYRDLRLHLHRQLNAEPDSQTAALFTQLRSQARRRAHVAEAAAPSQPSSPPPCHLPRPLTDLVGREEEVAQVGALLRQQRLVTLTGTGGIGKTRLALAVAETTLEEFPEGIWFVELAALSDPRLVVQAVASTLGISEQPGCSLQETLVDTLQSKPLLLVLDNCEHLLAACAQLSDRLLQACAGLRVLATSRQSLGIAGEHAYRVPSLLQPDLKTLPYAEKELVSVLADYEAVRLFVERARAQRSDFGLSVKNAPAVAEVCHRLDGIPLAIELAASRVNVLTVEQIAIRLEDRFRLLTGGSRTALPRQQTLQTTLDWSYELLTPKERLLLSRLSVFVGGWQLEAAEKVCSDEQIEDFDVLDVLASLVEKSLVIFEELKGKPRYHQLETIREYAWHRLQESGKQKQWRDRHLDYFLRLAEEAELELVGEGQAEWLGNLQEEYDNLRAGLKWCQMDKDSQGAGVRLAGSLFRFWDVRGYFSEGREHLQAVLSPESASQKTPARAKALNGAGGLAWRQGDYAAAQALHEQCLAIRRELGDKRGIAASLGNLGLVAQNQGDYAAARALFEECLGIFRESGDKWCIALSLNGLGLVAEDQGDYAGARALYEECLAIKRELGDKDGIAHALNNLGVVLENLGDFAAARTLHEQSLAIRTEIGDKSGIAISLMNQGIVATEQGDHAVARTLHEQSLALFGELGDKRGIAYSLEALAALAARQGQPEWAVRLWAAAETLREAIGSPLPTNEKEKYVRKVAAVRTSLGEQIFVTAWEQGQTMTFEQAIDYALQTEQERKGRPTE